MSTISAALPNPPNNATFTVNGSLGTGTLSIVLNEATTSLGSEGVGVIYKKDADGLPIASSVEFVHWTSKNDGTKTLTLTNSGDRGVTGSASGAQAHDSGDTFEVWVHSAYHFYSWMDVEHSADGTHDSTKVPVVSGSASTTLTVTGSTNVTLPTSGTLATLAGTETFTNKRITRRVVTLTDAATVTPNADTTDQGILTSLSQTTTIANPSGTPTDGQLLELRIKSSSSRSLSFGTQYRSGVDVVLPSATSGSSLTDYYLFQFNSADTKWDILAKATGY